MDKLIIIDGNSLANRAFYGVPLLTNSKGVYTNAVYGFINMMLGFFKKQEISAHNENISVTVTKKSKR